MTKLVFSCPCCSQPFTPVPNNKNRQRYCTRKRCKRRRKRECQRKWHQARYAEDEVFRTAAKARVAQHREREKKPPPPPVTALLAEVRLGLSQLDWTLLGLAGQIGGEDDPVRAAELVSRWTDLGIRHGAGMPVGP